MVERIDEALPNERTFFDAKPTRNRDIRLSAALATLLVAGIAVSLPLLSIALILWIVR